MKNVMADGEAMRLMDKFAALMSVPRDLRGLWWHAAVQSVRLALGAYVSG